MYSENFPPKPSVETLNLSDKALDRICRVSATAFNVAFPTWIMSQEKAVLTIGKHKALAAPQANIAICRNAVLGLGRFRPAQPPRTAMTLI